jgi:cellulose synthase/poly-beta-1,6-N-acetylglucosamine synthase-like glycosyltransferase
VTAFVQPFANLPTWAHVLFLIAFAIVLGVLCWTAVLFVLSLRDLRSAPDPDDEAVDRFLWVFLVPALNEAVTIADSVSRLVAVEARNKAILVIDDGSTDGTAAALDAIESDELRVLHRVPPDAHAGKAAALNAAWRSLDQLFSAGRWAGWSRRQVIVCIVDADGRLAADAPRFAAAHFANDRVGGLQVLVRIYNRSHVLAWCQDFEFSVFGLLFQAGRSAFGAAGMGGNGQFNRLAALDDVAGELSGPWHDRLTEDQDLGLRLLEAGWVTHADARTTVDQQGLSSLRRLLRQRTRWAQGNLQAMGHIHDVSRMQRSWLVRADQVTNLLQPALQATVGLAFIASIFLFAFGVVGFWGDNNWLVLGSFFLLGFGGVALGALARGLRRGGWSIVTSLLAMPLYAAYAWMIFPVLASALFRQITNRRTWAKTAREPIGQPSA